MAMKIRLARGGAQKRPYYSILASDSRAPRGGPVLGKLGPHPPLPPTGSEERGKRKPECLYK